VRGPGMKVRPDLENLGRLGSRAAPGAGGCWQRSGSGALAAAAARGGLGRRVTVTPPGGGEVR
jgi:hypothetical protein